MEWILILVIVLMGCVVWVFIAERQERRKQSADNVSLIADEPPVVEAADGVMVGQSVPLIEEERKWPTQKDKMKPALVALVAILTVLVIALVVAATVPMITVGNGDYSSPPPTYATPPQLRRVGEIWPELKLPPEVARLYPTELQTVFQEGLGITPPELPELARVIEDQKAIVEESTGEWARTMAGYSLRSQLSGEDRKPTAEERKQLLGAGFTEGTRKVTILEYLVRE